MPLHRLIPSALVVAMLAMELYASRVQRAEAQNRDRGSFFATVACIGFGYWAACGLWSYGRTPWPLGE
jgi:hypothetical protein